MIEISIITPAYNATKTIQKLLEALQRQTYDKRKFEVLIIDDGSTDGTREYVERYIAKNHELNLHLLTQNHQGQGHARNRGIEVAQGRIIAFTDADCVPDSDWLAQAKQLIDANHKLVSGLTYCRDAIIYPWKVSPAGQRGITANLVVDKAIIGDTKFRLLNCEDTDFILQLEAKSPDNKMVCSDTLKVEHPTNTLTLKGAVRFARKRRSETLLLKLHGRRVYSSMNVLYRPLVLGAFSPIFLGTLCVVAGTVWLGFRGLLLDLILALIFGGLFVYRGYKLVMPNGSSGVSVNVRDRFKTLYYFSIYTLVHLAFRVEASIKFRKVVI